MSPKAATKDRKSRQRGTAAAEAIDPEAYYVLRVNLSGSPPLLFPFSKDLYLKVRACACQPLIWLRAYSA